MSRSGTWHIWTLMPSVGGTLGINDQLCRVSDLALGIGDHICRVLTLGKDYICRVPALGKDSSLPAHVSMFAECPNARHSAKKGSAVDGRQATLFCRVLAGHTTKTLSSARQKTLGKELFAVKIKTSVICRVLHSAKSCRLFSGFCRVLLHLAYPLFLVVMLFYRM